ncbi:MAG: hypothetical protein A3E57_08985 [Candidatus Muproteobacteria bacterium RIFCSPHIGHO2_12_FULL_60_33]|nr:MAG: hypothetical protein A3E57_08985 [Candidatus Muproteobacteria bacterium RIFCSPHIGHO2_12_FULL_60_33]
MVLGLLAIHLALIPALFVGVLYVFKQGYQEQFVQYVRSDAAALARQLAGMSPRGARLQALLEEAILDSRLVFVEVVDGGGRRLAAAGDVPGAFVEDFFFGQHDDRTYHVALPFGADGALGTVLLGYDETPAREQVGLVYRRGAYLALAYVLLTLGMAVLVGLKLTRPLRCLIEAAGAIAAGAYDRRVDLRSRDEIGELGVTFNRMAAAVSDKTARIAALNDTAVKITSVRSLQEMLDEILRRGAALTGAQAACIAFYNQETGLFDKWVTQGLSDHFVKNMAFRQGGLADEAYVMAAGTYVLSNDQPETKHKLSRLMHAEGIQSFICLPLMSHAERLGVIYFYRKDRDYFLPDEIEILTTFASLAAGAIANIRLQEQTRDLAVTDKLTGLHNRRLFDERIQEEIRRATRYVKPLSLLMIDIDNFKHINDTHGHAAGDVVLQSLGRLLPRLLREVDLPARYGGEEFTVILPETDFVGARLVGERIRRAIAGERVTLPGGGEISFTASVGVACFPVCGNKAGSFIEHADQALYTAKQEGKNRVCLYREILKVQLENDPERIADLLNQSLDNIQPIVTAVSAKSVYYYDHAEKVNTISKQLAEALNLGEEDRRTLALASQLHDIGMISVPDAVLNKQGALTDDDWKFIRQHPATAAGLVEKVPGLRHLAPIILHHHARFDGKGYPEGLKGDAIPYLARVLAVADTYASMMGKWMGSEVMSPAEARSRIAAAAGGQLDPQIVAAFLQMPDR